MNLYIFTYKPKLMLRRRRTQKPIGKSYNLGNKEEKQNCAAHKRI